MDLDPGTLLFLLVTNIICARAAQIIAPLWGRSARLWLILTVVIGPLMLGVLVLLPRKAPAIA